MERRHLEVQSPAPSGTADRVAALALQTTVGHLIRRAQQAHTALWNAELAGELTGPQYAVLSVLSRRGVLDQRSAGELASLDKSSMADVVARLQRSGWIFRDHSDHDGRRNDLTITAPARTALRGITPRAAIVQKLLLSALDHADQLAFLGQLSAVAYGGRPPPAEAAQDERGPALRLSTTPGHLIRRAEQLHRQHWQKRVGPGFTPTQYALLSSLSWHPDVDQTTAGALASLDKSTTVDIVRRLIQRGLLIVTRDAQDRRRKRAIMTPAALAALDTLTPSVSQVQQDLLEPLSETEAAAFVTSLHDLAYREGKASSTTTRTPPS